MDQQSPALDIERIIRQARLRSSREPHTALVPMLFQALHKRDPSVRLRFRMMTDAGRSTSEQVFAIEYQDTLWTVRGPGDWKRQMELALARQSQTWKNPQIVPMMPGVEEDLEKQVLTMDFPLSKATQGRIEAAVCASEGALLDRATPATAPQPRKRSRF